MLDGIEQLRKEIQILNEHTDIETDELVRIADAIEREVEERYIERPVDADDMTISPSDSMVNSNWGQFTVSSIELIDSGEWLVSANGRLGNEFAKLCHHYKPSTVEDVLREIVHKCQPTYSKDGSYTTGLTEEEFSEYAERLQLKEGE